MSFINCKEIAQLSISAAMLTFSCFFSCMHQDETRTKSDDRNLRNSASTFIYNAIPENPQAVISEEYSDAINAFAVDLLGEIYRNDSYKGKNLVISPLCISRNLAVIAEAVTGESKQELLRVLGGRPALDDATAALSRLLYADRSVILQIADAVWVDSTEYSLIPSFRETANSKYGVEATELNLDDAAGSVNTINRWIAANTDNRIKDVVKENQINSLTALVITSAIYNISVTVTLLRVSN